MCPVCLATLGLYVAGGVSAGGITTHLATRFLRRRRDSRRIDPTWDGGERTIKDDRHRRQVTTNTLPHASPRSEV